MLALNNLQMLIRRKVQPTNQSTICMLKFRHTLEHVQCAHAEYYKQGRSHCGEVANVLDCNIVVSEFELQSLYSVHFWIILLRKQWILIFHPALSSIVTLLTLLCMYMCVDPWVGVSIGILLGFYTGLYNPHPANECPGYDTKH